jgi:hypothetical protein
MDTLFWVAIIAVSAACAGIMGTGPLIAQILMIQHVQKVGAQMVEIGLARANQGLDRSTPAQPAD